MSNIQTCEFDLFRFGYVLKSRLKSLGLTVRQVAGLTGCSTRQISYACNGKPISAAATWMLAQLCEIDLETMLPLENQEMLHRIWKMQQKHAVTPPVTREKEEINA